MSWLRWSQYHPVMVGRPNATKNPARYRAKFIVLESATLTGLGFAWSKYHQADGTNGEGAFRGRAAKRNKKPRTIS
ncbi:hypothetical protein, partial [Gorillibacterium massiliense]|uniref:hypothetical protein n=1 Tax=Gorillibacterium massiliense TaxID=1280390 RepID=UPI001EE24DF9